MCELLGMTKSPFSKGGESSTSPLNKGGLLPTKLWIAPPTKMDADQLTEGYADIFANQGRGKKCWAVRCVCASGFGRIGGCVFNFGQNSDP